jgi:hypothetical protein
MRMKTSPKNESQRDELEYQANVARTKLVVTLGELDRRGHELFDVKKMVRRHRKGLALLAATAALVTLAAAVFVARRRASRPRRLRSQRVDALRRAWAHPEWIAPKHRSFGSELGRRLAMTAAEAVGSRAIERVLVTTVGPERPEQSALAHDPTEAHA